MNSIVRKAFPLGLLLLPGILILFGNAHIRCNYTDDSAPRGVYGLTRGAPARGGLVLLCLPPRIATAGRQRGYLGPGRCPAHAREILKRVAALPGDTVEPTRSGLLVNGEPLPNTAPLLYDGHGRLLLRPTPVPQTVAPGSLWVYSDHIANSWDSRYFGAIPLSSVRNLAHPVLLWGRQ